MSIFQNQFILQKILNYCRVGRVDSISQDNDSTHTLAFTRYNQWTTLYHLSRYNQLPLLKYKLSRNEDLDMVSYDGLSVFLLQCNEDVDLFKLVHQRYNYLFQETTLLAFSSNKEIFDILWNQSNPSLKPTNTTMSKQLLKASCRLSNYKSFKWILDKLKEEDKDWSLIIKDTDFNVELVAYILTDRDDDGVRQDEDVTPVSPYQALNRNIQLDVIETYKVWSEATGLSKEILPLVKKEWDYKIDTNIKNLLWLGDKDINEILVNPLGGDLTKLFNLYSHLDENIFLERYTYKKAIELLSQSEYGSKSSAPTIISNVKESTDKLAIEKFRAIQSSTITSILDLITFKQLLVRPDDDTYLESIHQLLKNIPNSEVDLVKELMVEYFIDNFKNADPKNIFTYERIIVEFGAPHQIILVFGSRKDWSPYLLRSLLSHPNLSEIVTGLAPELVKLEGTFCPIYPSTVTGMQLCNKHGFDYEIPNRLYDVESRETVLGILNEIISHNLELEKQGKEQKSKLSQAACLYYLGPDDYELSTIKRFIKKVCMNDDLEVFKLVVENFKAFYNRKINSNDYSALLELSFMGSVNSEIPKYIVSLPQLQIVRQGLISPIDMVIKNSGLEMTQNGTVIEFIKLLESVITKPVDKEITRYTYYKVLYEMSKYPLVNQTQIKQWIEKYKGTFTVEFKVCIQYGNLSLLKGLITDYLMDNSSQFESIIHYSMVYGKVELLKWLSNSYHLSISESKPTIFKLLDKYKQAISKGSSNIEYYSPVIRSYLESIGYSNVNTLEFKSDTEEVELDLLVEPSEFKANEEDEEGY